MRLPVPVLVVIALLLGLGSAAAAEAQPAAQLQVSVDPPEPTLRGSGTLDIRVNVRGVISCTPALTELQPPEPVRGRIVAQENGVASRLQVVFEPAEFALDWTRETVRTFTMNETVDVRVIVGAAPTSREQTSFSVLIDARGAQETRPRCSPDGYNQEMQEEVVPLILQPEDEGFLAPITKRINWGPIVLALLILAVVTAFAVQRERGRDGDGTA
jgi:hypothetical protein